MRMDYVSNNYRKNKNKCIDTKKLVCLNVIYFIIFTNPFSLSSHAQTEITPLESSSSDCSHDDINMLDTLYRSIDTGVHGTKIGSLFATGDVLPQICQYLNIGDKCTVAQVCKSFRWAVNQDLLHRGVEAVKLPFLPAADAEDLRRILHVKPQKWVIFLTDDHPLFEHGVTNELLTTYAHQLPQTSKILHAKGFSVLYNGEPVEVFDSRAVGIFFPTKRDVSVNGFFLTAESVEFYGQPISDEVFSADLRADEGFLGLIVFKRILDEPHPVVETFISDLKNRFQTTRGGVALWGAALELLATNENDANVYTILAILKLAGSRLQTWSLVIDLNKPLSEVRDKMQKFRNMIKVRPSRSTALGLHSTDIFDSPSERDKRDSVFRESFPGFTLVSFGVESDSEKYCLDSFGSKPDLQQIIYTDSNIVCYMIIN